MYTHVERSAQAAVWLGGDTDIQLAGPPEQQLSPM